MQKYRDIRIDKNLKYLLIIDGSLGIISYEYKYKYKAYIKYIFDI